MEFYYAQGIPAGDLLHSGNFTPYTESLQGILLRTGNPCREFNSVQGVPAWSFTLRRESPQGVLLCAGNPCREFYSAQGMPPGNFTLPRESLQRILLRAGNPCRDLYSLQGIPVLISVCKKLIPCSYVEQKSANSNRL